MVFPILPLYGSNSIDIVNKNRFLLLAGQSLLDCVSFNGQAQIIDFVQKFKELKLVSIYLNDLNEFSGDDVVNLLNNGISTVFTKQAVLKESLINEFNVPAERIVLFDSKTSSYPNKFVVVDDFKESRIINAQDISLGLFQDSIINAIRTDRDDKLYTTLVVDEYEKCLGLVYSSLESIKIATEKKIGCYYSRSRNEIWIKGLTSGNTQDLVSIEIDCDGDSLKFVVIQNGNNESAKPSFCHLNTESCFGELNYGLQSLEKTLKDRLINAPEDSYTKRLFNDDDLLNAKIKEEAEELTEAVTSKELSWEAADLFYFAMAKLVKNGVSLRHVENNLKMKHLKITRRRGDAKPKFIQNKKQKVEAKVEGERDLTNKKIYLNVIKSSNKDDVEKAISRPIQKTSEIMHLVNPIVQNVKEKGDKALLEYTEKFDGIKLSTPVLCAPFPKEYFEGLTQEMKESLDLSMENVRKFHAAQLQTETMVVETQPGVVCSRFSRPIERVGLYIPGGTAILPSTALMLGVPAKVAKCKEIIFASPPRKSDGKVSPEVVYVASKVGASKIVLAGGAQAVAAMAYGTESVPKVDKILGPGNQFVTAAKMYIQNDTQALCSIDMPAGPSEVLVVCDENADADFVASDLLSQAEHGVDSQVILVGVNLSEKKILEVQDAVDRQANELPRVDIVRKCIAHSTIILCESYEEAFGMSNKYAPEHLILQIENAQKYVSLVDNAGSIFVGQYTPESCGDYSSGTNHTLPTYGYARQYSGVNTSTFQKFITSQQISPEGLQNIGKAVMCVAKVEGLDGHRNAVKIRMQKLGQLPTDFE
ncbi:hypothetical protein TPHA_0E03690 [Tetrapisispora phaffii CBS 4417]|uniref:Histidine biosynthesis trifunctional protein n=1 Tax=Tetrapisispora phaffii (strain ATCC 24235 / CBS 4417 / NBRC 1672 / NRRL Y-8282 / UCD 70-5) TaxID=1071381 RepID=G8BU80_TETPH|nr:hypothetical protein TPHA_0E03690 [Tetrapisispora phaffii CBS 4417]CCE63458.1 hypothetical protein TPHA_0E03690 [Tetrapisispora phaffii CBS 4417]